MANLQGHATKADVVTDEKTGKVVSVDQNTVVTDPESDLAVQIPPEGDGTKEDPLAVHNEPSPEEVFAKSAKSSKSSKSDK